MPNAGEMAHLSRPYQIALGALVVLALAWFVVLHRPGSSPSEPTPAATPAAATKAPAAAAGAKASAAGGSTPVYNGPVPGLHGLTRDIARAHGAVATSETNAAQLAQKSAQASTSQTPAASTPSTPSTPSTSGTPNAASATSAAGTAGASSAGSTTGSSVSKIVSGLSTGAAAATVQQAKQKALLQGELNHGKIVLLLFWNPKATDDAVTYIAAEVAAHKLKGKVALHVALASQVSLYGSVTRNVGVFQTPTLLVIDKKGLATTLTGLTDLFTIEQAVSEARADLGSRAV
jgi:hypothetical protein